MTDEELSKLIREFLPYPSKDQHYALRSFAKLVAAAEREACAKVLDEMAAKDKLSNYYVVAALAIRERGAREWQTLTENEIKHLWYEACQTNLELTSQLIVHLARNIESKLKEKNHG